MDSISLEIDDIFGDQLHGDEDDDDDDGEQAMEMLPNLPDIPTAENWHTPNDDDAENQEVLSKLKALKGASKSHVRRILPKLDGTRLIGKNGIPILPQIFKNIKLKGKGYEIDDLNVVMHKLEHWAHRLFPSMPFDDVLERIERLGEKREVQTCIKRIRMDMPMLAGETVVDDEIDSEEHSRFLPTDKESDLPNAEELFDKMLSKQVETSDVTPKLGEQLSVPSQSSSLQNSLSCCSTSNASTAFSSEMTRTVERKRQLALLRRAERSAASSSSAVPSSLDSLTSET